MRDAEVVVGGQINHEGMVLASNHERFGSTYSPLVVGYERTIPTSKDHF